MNSRKKICKSVCFAMSLLTAINFSNLHVFAGDGDEDPVQGNSNLIGKVKEHFGKQSLDTDGGIMPVVFPQGRTQTKEIEQIKFVLPDGTPVKTTETINPKEHKDHRILRFYNIPALLTEDKSLVGTSHGAPTGNIPIRLLVDMYLDGMAKCQEILEGLKVDFGEEMKVLSEELLNSIEKDSALQRKIHELSDRMGVTYEQAQVAYASLMVTESMAKRIITDIEGRTKWYHNALNRLKRYNFPLAVIGSGGLGASASLVGIEVGGLIGSALCPGVGTAVGSVIGYASALVISFVAGGAIGYGSLKLMQSAAKRDKEVEKDIHSVIEFYDTHLLQERANNYAMLMRQILHFMNNEPQKVMDSNLFITAVDHRNFVDIEKLKAEKDYRTAEQLSQTENQSSWCDFKYMPDLKNAPTARDYKTKDGRSIGYLIDVFRAASHSDGKKIDYHALKQYVDGTKLPSTYQVVSSSIVDKIRMYLELDIEEDKIVQLILKESDSQIKPEDILRIVHAQRATMN